MRLRRLAIQDFRNLERVELDTDAPFVVLHGANAQGKTNLLEAVYTLATLKSFRARRNRELIRWGQDEAVVEGLVDDGTLVRELRVSIGPRGRKGTVDGKAPGQLRDYFDSIRAVLFAPEDVAIVREGPDIRRRFVDRAAFTASPTFLELAWTHQRLLDQKGAMLRDPPVDPVQLEVFDAQLAAAGARLVERRMRIVAELREPFAQLHGRISGHGEATMRYRGCLGEGDLGALQARYAELLDGSRADAIRRGTNLVGPQRDDLDLRIDGQPARAYASQGQTRSVVLALKLAELLAARERGARPLFLLDDLSSELDRLRTGRLVELLVELELQVFVTTTEPAVVAGAAGAEQLLVELSGGAVSGLQKGAEGTGIR